MKSKISTIIVWILFIAMFSLPILSEVSYLFEDVSLNPNDYARITDVEYKAVVVDEPGSEGKVVITERLTFDIHAASKDNLFWELWRDLPEDYIDGVKVDYQVNSVKQIYSDGTEVIYEESPKLYWDDYDYVSYNTVYGPGKWYHSEGPYDEANAQYECVFFYVDGLYREEVVFEIEYEMHNAALRYNDCSDLYISLYSGETIKYLESFKAEILFPNKDMPSAGNYDVYTYGTNSNDFPVTKSTSKNPGYHTFSFELDEEDLKFKPYNEYIEFDLVSYGKDKHIFTEYAPDNYYSDEDVLEEIYDEQNEYATAPERYAKIKLIVFIVSLILSALIVFWGIRKVSGIKKKYTFYEPDFKGEYFREIPSDLDPNFAANLVFCKEKPQKDDSGVYSAILLSLARKDYIELIERANNDVLIHIKPRTIQTPEEMPLSDMVVNTNLGNGLYVESVETKTYEPLTLCEEYYYNLLVRHAAGDHIHMSEFQQRVSSDYENTASFARNMKNSIVNIGVKEGYFQKANYTQPKDNLRSFGNVLLVIGLLTMILVNIISNLTRLELAYGAFFIFGISCCISSIYLKEKSRKYILLTQKGEDEYAKWKGLYNFLNSDALLRDQTLVELSLWEKYLVYATAFGLSEKVLSTIRIRCPEADTSSIVNNHYCRSGRIRTSGRSFSTSVRSGSHGGSSGGGFGYGGGGRGGGGGGGGH